MKDRAHQIDNAPLPRPVVRLLKLHWRWCQWRVDRRVCREVRRYRDLLGADMEDYVRRLCLNIFISTGVQVRPAEVIQATIAAVRGCGIDLQHCGGGYSDIKHAVEQRLKQRPPAAMWMQPPLHMN